MNRGTTIFNEKLLEFWRYKDHPQMMPFIGKYWGQYKKLLVIGESHYLAPGGAEFSKDWYDLPIECLEADDIEWTNTAKIIDETQYKSGSHSIYRNIDYAIRETGFKPDESVFCYVAYMNFFQRPAEETHESINASNEDIEIANETLKYVCDIIEPEYLFFISRKAHTCLDKTMCATGQIGCSAHPASSWWNRENSEDSWRTGKQAFMDFIKEKKIFG